MSEVAVLEIQRMRVEFARLVESLSPWLSTEEMCARYTCTPQTLRNMERRGDIPTRANGRWNRIELMQWEAAKH